MRTIEVYIKTGCKNSKVVLKDGIYNVFVRSRPIEDRANKELIEVLSKYFNVPKSNLEIKRGLKSRRKIIIISE